MEDNKKSEPVLENGNHSLCPTIAVLIISIIFILIGFAQGEINSYFQKAVMVCTQCIGLG